MNRHLFALLPLTALALIPACAKQAATTPAGSPAATGVDHSGSTPGEPEVAPPPRPVSRKGEPANDPVDGELAHQGRQLFLKLQCIRCHSATPTGKAPLLEGLYGTKVPLKGGGTATADDAYIIESIRKPKAKVVEGWEPSMPAYDKDQVSDEDMKALVAFIRSLKKGEK
jgi:mono/diheme cytochrome c family protein